MKKDTPTGKIGCSVPLHRELKIGTLRGILKQAQVEPEDFITKCFNYTKAPYNFA